MAQPTRPAGSGTGGFRTPPAPETLHIWGKDGTKCYRSIVSIAPGIVSLTSFPDRMAVTNPA
jgi:hypothetical protein